MNSLVEKVSEIHRDPLTKKQQRQISVAVLLYVFKFINSNQFTKQFQVITGNRSRGIIDLRRDLLCDGYIMKNIKCWYFYLFANGLLRKERERWQRKFRILDKDMELLSFSNDVSKNMEKLDKYSAWSLSKFDRKVYASLCRTKTFAKKFSYRKLTFIVKSQGITHEDLVADMQETAIKAVMLFYPRLDSEEHLDNLVKRTIHNKGMNLIDFYTGDKRSTTVKNNGTNMNRCYSIDVARIEHDEQYTDFLTTSLDGKEKDMQMEIAVKQVVSKYSGKRRQFLKLCMGYDKPFSDWLKENSISSSPNDEYMERCKDMKTYFEHAMNYLKIKPERGERFVKRLKKKLKDVNN